MRKTNTLKQLGVLLLFLMSFSMAWANNNYYARAAAHAKGATGAGLVYASKTNSAPADSDYGTDITSDYNTNKGSSSDKWAFYLWAKTQGDGIFKGWYSTSGCTGTPLSTSLAYTTDKFEGQQDNTNYAKDFYALFVYHYYATVNAAAVGEGGTVSVNGGAAGATASATLVSDDMQVASTNLSFSLSAEVANSNHYFVGWYSDAECTNQVSDQLSFNVSVNTSATNAAAAVTENYYAKFEEIVRNDYTFNLVANPDHVSILGGEEGGLSALECSVAGVDITSAAAPYYNFSITPAEDIIYSVKLYNGSELVSTLAENATEATSFAIANTDMSGARLVVESRQGWFLTVKANPEVITSLTGNGQPLAYSAEGVRNELTVSGDYEIAYTVANSDVISTIKFYNAAGEMIYMPFQNQGGAQSATIDAASIKGGKVEVEGLVFGADMPYFTIKADPALIKEISAEITSSYNTPTSWSIPLYFSAEGSINLYPANMDMVNDYLHLHVVPQNDNILYTLVKSYTKGANSSNAPNPGAVCNTYLHNTTSTEINEALVTIEGYELLEGPWTYTVIADPDLVTIRDNANGNATVACSLEGVEYSPAGQQSQLQIQGKVANKVYNAYFFPEGVELNDYDNAYMFKEGINVKNITSWYSTTDKKVPNTYGKNGTLLIKSLDGVGEGTVTINISGTAGNVVVTNGGNEVKNLKLGANTVTLSAAILSFTHKTNGSHLASVTCNDVALKEGNSEGKFSYTNKFAANGDVYDIVTDYANTEYDVYIDVTEGCEAFVKEVTIDDKAVTWTAGQPVKVDEGKTIRVQGDKLNYVVNAVTINDEPQIVNNSASKQILADTRISFDVTYINRDKSLTFEIGSNAKGDYKTALNSYEEVSSTKTIAFCDMDNPIDFGGTCTSSVEKEWVGRWYVNGEFKATGIQFLYSANSGDRIKVEFVDGETIETTYNVTFSRSEGLEAWPDVTVDGEAKTPGNMALTANQVIVIKSNEYVNVTGVKVNNARQTPNEDGEYVITVVDEDLRIEIIGEAVADAPTFTLNITGDAEKLYVADAENEFIEGLQEGENVIDMTTLPEGPIFITNMWTSADYYVSAISLNGVSIYGDEEYYIDYLNGMYRIEVQADDVIDVTISLFSRDNVLKVYIDGIDATMGCTISDKYNSAGSLVEDEEGNLGGTLKDGLNIVRFADTDLPLNFQMMGLIDASSTFSIKLGDEEIEFTPGTGYLINCADDQELYVVVVENVEQESIVINESCITTYASHNDLSFGEGNDVSLFAYIAVGYDSDKQEVEFVRVTGTIPAGTGLFIVSTDKKITEHNVPVVHTSRSKTHGLLADDEEGDEEEQPQAPEYSLEDNLLVPAYKYTTIPTADETNDRYTFGTIDGVTGFHLVTEPATAESNQAYLVLPKDNDRPIDVINFGNIVEPGVPSGISAITIDSTTGAVYNTLGVKIADSLDAKRLAPGMYIIDGHKIIIRK